MTARLYLDHNASTPVDPRVLARFTEVERKTPGNPASLHGTGRAARAVLEDAREQVARALGVAAEEVVFVSGGTEADNLAVLRLGESGLPALMSAVEHPAVWEPGAERGRVELGVDACGRARIRAPDRAVGLVCLVHAQSEVGTVQPVAAAAELARVLGVPLHVDAAQSLGRIPVAEVLELADTIAVSCHKLGGLRGGGMLIGRGVRGLEPILRGGGQELGVRAGTVSPALAAANALAVELAVSEQEERAARMRAARDAFLDGLAGVAFDLLTPAADGGLPNTAMCRFEGVEGRSLLPALDRAGVESSHGSACSSGAPTPPRVLLAMGLDEDEARTCVRFSVSHRTELRHAHEAAQRAAASIMRLRDA